MLMSTEQNKANAHRFYEEVWNLAVADELNAIDGSEPRFGLQLVLYDPSNPLTKRRECDTCLN